MRIFFFPLLKYLVQRVLKLSGFNPSILSLFHVALKNTKDPSSHDLFKKIFFTNSVITKPFHLYLFFQEGDGIGGKKKIPFAICPVVLKIKLTSTDLLEISHPQNQAPFYHRAWVSALSPSALPALHLG